MDQFPPPDSQTSPLAIASVVLAILGVVVYCCGSFFCLGFLAFLVWIAGAACGGIALTQGVEGNSKVLAWVGLGLNLLMLVGFAALMVLGMSVGVLSEMANQL